MKPKIVTTILVSAKAMLMVTSGAFAQNIFVANWYYPGDIYEFTPGGSESTFTSGGMGEPEGLAFDSSGTLFLADSLANAVDKFSSDGTPAAFVSVSDPHGLVFNAAGILFVSSFDTGNIYEFTSSGSQSLFTSGLAKPTDMAFDSSGDLFVATAGDGDIYEYKNSGGTLSATGTLFAQGLTLPDGLAFNAAGNLFVCENSGDIKEFTSQGVESPFAVLPNSPNDIAFDSSGNLYVTDADDLVEISPDGTSQSIVATGLGNTTGLAIQGMALPVPEPSSLTLAFVGGAALLFRRRKN